MDLREEIIGILNQAIKRISVGFGPATSLVVKGLPDPKEVEKAFLELTSGSRTFVSFVDQLSLL